MYLFLQGHFSHSPQLPARLHPRWTPGADRRGRPQSEKTSSSRAFHQTPPGQPDVSVTLLPSPKHKQEQVHMHYRQKVSEHLIIKEIDQNMLISFRELDENV